MEQKKENTSTFQSDNPIVQQILSGKAPQNIKLAAAKGALPLSPEELLHVLFMIKDDKDPSVSMAVVKTIDDFSDDDLSVLISSESLSGDLLDFYAKMAIDKEKTAINLLGNPTVGDETVTFLARRVGAEALEIIVTNQVRLIRHPAIIKSCFANKALQPDQSRRLHELEEEFFVKKKAEDERIRQEEEEVAKAKEAAAAEEAKEAPPVAAPPVQKPAAAPSPVAEAEEEEELTTYQKMMKMSVPEKIQLALKGTKEERSLLIRDSNRVVFMAVIQSPKLSEGEVEQIAAMRNVPEEILRTIGNNREWMKKYTVMLQLVRNPKAPVGVTMNFIPRLNPRDLKVLSVDKNIPEVIRRSAKQIVDRQTSRKR
jgi:hypothetical protein